MFQLWEMVKVNPYHNTHSVNTWPWATHMLVRLDLWFERNTGALPPKPY